MPQTTHTTHPLYPNLVLTFTEEDHKYVDNEGRVYTSGTALVHTQFEEFDMTAAAQRVAAKQGTTPEAIIAKWEAKRDYACRYGTRCHELAESLLTVQASGVHHEPEDAKEVIAFECIRLACIQLMQRFDLIACEQVLFSPQLKLAGTTDLLMQTRDRKTVLLLDWKSNEANKMSTDYFKMGRDLCSDIPDNALSHYGLQLSIYECLLRSEGHVSPDQNIIRALIHIPPFSKRPIWMPLQFVEAAKTLTTIK